MSEPRYVPHTPLFLMGLGFATMGATVIMLGALDAWQRGAARFSEQLQPEKYSLFVFGAVCGVIGWWLIRLALRRWRAR